MIFFLILQHEATLSAFRRSLSWTTLQSSGSHTTAMKMPAKSNKKPVTNKYLELLGDNEDSDGYQLPLQVNKSLRQAAPCASRAVARSPMASPQSSYKEMQPSFLLSHLPFTSVPLDSSGSSDLPGERNLQHSPELDSMLEPDPRHRSGSSASAANSERSWMEDCDMWSFSTASTASCPNTGSQENLTSAISSMAGIDIKNPSDSSYC